MDPLAKGTSAAKAVLAREGMAMGANAYIIYYHTMEGRKEVSILAIKKSKSKWDDEANHYLQVSYLPKRKPKQR
jgi:hypothetical protein